MRTQRSRRHPGGLVALACAAPAALALPAVAAERIEDVEYESPGAGDTCQGPCNLLDVYLPDGGARPDAPTVMFIHGGGFWAGDKDDLVAFMTWLADAGIPGVSCNYTLSTPEAPSYPQAVFDVKAVVRWIRTTGAETYGLPGTIVVSGASAGGLLCMMIGVTAGVDQFEPLAPPPGGYLVDAMTPLWGRSDLRMIGPHANIEQFLGVEWEDPPPPVYAEASPITYVDPCDPPAAMFHGRRDARVPWEQSQIMHDALEKLGVYSEIHINESAGHGFGDWGGLEAVAALVADRIPVLLANDCDADIDCSGAVDFEDILAILAAWGNEGGPEDLDGSGVVDFGDLLIVLAAWGPCIPPTPADDCGDAPVVGDGTYEYSTLSATTDGPNLPKECDEGNGVRCRKDVWIRYVASCSGTATASVCDSDFDTRIVVYEDGDCPGPFLACNDDACGADGTRSEVSFPVQSGGTYLIRIGSPGFGTGEGTLVIDCAE